MDRGVDPLAPLLHEFSYQAMIGDLMELENGGLGAEGFKLKRKEEAKDGKDGGDKVVSLDDSDQIYVSFSTLTWCPKVV
jgi:syntaxin-binding protein 1